MNRRTALKYAFSGIAAISLTLVVGWWQVDGPGASEQTELRPVSLSEMEFRLSDHEGDEVGPETLIGSPTMVFFGFTYCPDVCPTTMSFLAELKENLVGTEAESTRVVMVSVDPARDTVEQLAQYVPYFHPEFLGVTGDFPDILSFARRFNAPFRKVTMEDGDYQIDHSANVVLINPKGDFHGFFRAPLDLAKVKVTLRSAQYYWSQQYD